MHKAILHGKAHGSFHGASGAQFGREKQEDTWVGTFSWKVFTQRASFSLFDRQKDRISRGILSLVQCGLSTAQEEPIVLNWTPRCKSALGLPTGGRAKNRRASTSKSSTTFSGESQTRPDFQADTVSMHRLNLVLPHRLECFFNVDQRCKGPTSPPHGEGWVPVNMPDSFPQNHSSTRTGDFLPCKGVCLGFDLLVAACLVNFQKG